MRIEFEELHSLRTWPRNPKAHDTPEIISSFERFGFVAPIIFDEKTGRIVAGHGRLEAAVRMRQEGKPAPARVEVTASGEWKVPVLRGIAFDTETEAQAYLLADNFLSEKGGWNPADLISALQAIKPAGFSGTGFNEKELKRLIAKHAGLVPLPGEDDAVQASKARTKRGMLWQIGQHRILCGNSTHPPDVAKLLAGAKPNLMVTDPPYGVNYDPEWRARAGVNKARRKMGSVLNDDRADWSQAWQLFPGNIGYVWHGGLHTAEVQQSLADSGFETRAQIIWAKDRFALSRGHYHWQHEPCIYAVRKDTQANWNGSRNQDTAEPGQGSFSDQMRRAVTAEDWKEITRIAQELDLAIQTTVWPIPAREDAGHGHGTQKPVECMRRPIVNHTSAGEIVYDPFIGSGSTIIAAESTGRACYAMDLDPRSVDIALERYETLTGSKAQKL